MAAKGLELSIRQREGVGCTHGCEGYKFNYSTGREIHALRGDYLKKNMRIIVKYLFAITKDAHTGSNDKVI